MIQPIMYPKMEIIILWRINYGESGGGGSLGFQHGLEGGLVSEVEFLEPPMAGCEERVGGKGPGQFLDLLFLHHLPALEEVPMNDLHEFLFHLGITNLSPAPVTSNDTIGDPAAESLPRDLLPLDNEPNPELLGLINQYLLLQLAELLVRTSFLPVPDRGIILLLHRVVCALPL